MTNVIFHNVFVRFNLTYRLHNIHFSTSHRLEPDRTDRRQGWHPLHRQFEPAAGLHRRQGDHHKVLTDAALSPIHLPARRDAGSGGTGILFLAESARDLRHDHPQRPVWRGRTARHHPAIPTLTSPLFRNRSETANGVYPSQEFPSILSMDGRCTGCSCPVS